MEVLELTQASRLCWLLTCCRPGSKTAAGERRNCGDVDVGGKIYRLVPVPADIVKAYMERGYDTADLLKLIAALDRRERPKLSAD